GGTPHAIPLSGPAGNVWSEASPPPSPLLQAATFRGLEALSDGATGDPLNKLYFNVALALDLDALGGPCTLSATATASDGPFETPFTTPSGSAWPLVHVSVPLVATETASAYSCTRNPLGDLPEDGVWVGYTGLDGAAPFAHRARVDGGAVVVEDAVALTERAVTVLAGASHTFAATGGTPPYAYSVVTAGGGSFAGAVYTAPSAPGTYTVRVSDAAGGHDDAVVTVNPGTLFVAVGGTSAFTSANGSTWTAASVQPTPPSGAGLGDVAYANGLFVAVGGVAGTSAYVAWSADGDVWTTAATIPATRNFTRVRAAAGVFLAGSSAGTAMSTDGDTWTQVHALGPYVAISGGAYFVTFYQSTCGSSGCYADVYRATVAPPTRPTTGQWDNITHFAGGSTQVNGVATAADGHLFYAAAGGLLRRASSGAEDTTIASGGFTYIADDAATPRTIVAVTDFGQTVYTSTDDGQTFTSHATGAATTGLGRVIWTGERFLLTADSPSTLYESADGLTWTSLGPLPGGAVTVKEH
ncbi:MAG: hypothetical protein KC635_11565, partial [Myxococcales bacterium]|nr:hypothetical protein [Myxococcales bacterium]